ncbi:protein CASP-like [Diadema setosum]|uniref:protein CASP-like n=1 Tax=Diadema setosum TaxID=31175 RepID=UPI003B3A9067
MSGCRYVELQEQFTQQSLTVAEQKELISQLEKDLLSVNALSSKYRGEGEGQATPSNTEAELVAKAVGETRSAAPVETAANAGAAESLLPIVSSQRERFRMRNQELEVENRQHQQHNLVLQTELDKLRQDNVKLYEKIRFLQSYPSSRGTNKLDDTESRYQSQYEERLDPFNSFSRKERMRKYMGLSPFDKATLNTGRLILSSKIARTIFLMYIIILHLLVFLVLYKMAHTESCKRDVASECVQKFAEHMHVFHPDDGHGVGAHVDHGG